MGLSTSVRKSARPRERVLLASGRVTGGTPGQSARHGLPSRLARVARLPRLSGGHFLCNCRWRVCYCSVTKIRLIRANTSAPKQVTRGFYSDVKGPRFEGDFEVDYTDIRRLQLLVDKLEQLLQVLQRNMDVGGEFCCFLERAQRLSPARLSGTFDETASIVHSCLLQHRIHSSRVQSLLARARGCGILVRYPLLLLSVD
jgi:hypothetical protein